ncbi:ATPase [Pseudomonas sp. MYb185]|uniref:ATPase n=1 Tax=Pseudomonas sp. MYb185 TaxID=1848729 RepID=UPI000CFB0226|nr:ATPase [Pseudomonas sp. MYb185]PRB83768.1 ATPase [Pseudomonas sp. MYb185]
MRNDDIDGDLPRIRATDDDRVTERPGAAEPPVVRAVREPTPRRQRNGALWAVCLSLLIALVGLGYWSHQQQSRLQRQLVATQESFARISEEAAGRLQDISGKVIATESNLSQGEQSRAQQLSQLEQKVEQLAAIQQTQQEALQEQQQRLQQAMETHTQRLTTLDGLAGTLGEQVERQQQSLTELTLQVESTSEAQAGLRNDLTQASERLQGLAELERQLEEQGTQLARQRGELQALLQASSGTSVEQEMLVLRSEIDQRLASTEDSLRAIDSFRLQANRNISTLQSQLSNLQQQMNQR